MSEHEINEALKALRSKLCATEHAGAIGALSARATKLAQVTSDAALLLAVGEFIDSCHSKLEQIRACRPKRLHSSISAQTMPQIRRKIGPWRVDEFGIRVREITSEEVSVA